MTDPAKPASRSRPEASAGPAANPEAEPGAEPGGAPAEPADLLTVGLLVFFVSVLLIVAALLVLPVILG